MLLPLSKCQRGSAVGTSIPGEVVGRYPAAQDAGDDEAAYGLRI